MVGPMSDQQFLAIYHIRRGEDFKRAYDRRCAASNHVLLVFGCPNGLPYSRLGLSVSRKVGGAVVRNRWKRLIRESFRLSRQALPEGIDFVVIPRPQPPRSPGSRSRRSILHAHPNLDSLLRTLPKLARRIDRKLQEKRK